MQAALEHVHFQMPNEHSRIGYLFTAINCGNTGLQAAMESIMADKTPTGLRNNCESYVSQFLPYDPFQKKYSNRKSGKHDSANISNTTVDIGKVAYFGAKKFIGRGESIFSTIAWTSTSN